MPLYMLNQLEVQYLHDYAGIRTRIGLTANPIVNFSGVLGSNVIALGTDVSFDTKTGEFTKCNGLSFSNADLIASLTLVSDHKTGWDVSFSFLLLFLHSF
ncbi:mitochondrial outer membrane protein porin of 34 kDa-like isoform X3 [Camellia sinensis]|uniref:mitochondrial outer membrane protein porin of 34 kDa-like isoform X3 n=1 Tax=Camellia sinensis TaxID=4442 RepID=UPI001035EDC0|nr:mitochondrial outer membrane protein porin of 34 kDa-like isoform X3 [Camellia sinensis]